MDSKNTLRLDFRDNADLKTLLGGLQPSDRITLEIELMTKSVDDESFEATVESITTDTEETVEDEDGEESTETKSKTVKPSADEPVMVVMASKAAKKKKPADEEVD